MTRIKICGITRAGDAELAAELGAWAVGFVFWPSSPRFVEPAEARTIAMHLPRPVVRVGVFVNQPVEDVLRVAGEVGLTMIQLLGDEPPEYVQRIPLPVAKAIPVSDGFDPKSLEPWPQGVLPLLDAADRTKRGGTGITIDWSAAARAARRRPVILSGGLNPENIRRAFQTVSPFAMDLSSGVESRPGIKDPVRLRALFEACADA